MDTLRIVDGEFEHILPMDREGVLFLLYPNYSQLPIFVNSGDDIHIKGDVQSLNEVEVSGSKSNELYTQFRKDIRNLPMEQTREVAKEYILKSPAEAISKYLLSQYFLMADSTSHEEVKDIFDSLCHACPEDLMLSRMAGDVRSHGLLYPGRKLPAFEIETRSEEDTTTTPPILSNKDIEGKYAIFVFWAGWKSGSQYTLSRAKRLQQSMKKELHLISYSLDIDKNIIDNIEKKDSLFRNSVSSFCDFYCWDSPLIKQWGIEEIPYIILIGPDGTIIANGHNWQHDIEPKAKELCL